MYEIIKEQTLYTYCYKAITKITQQKGYKSMTGLTRTMQIGFAVFMSLIFLTVSSQISAEENIKNDVTEKPVEALLKARAEQSNKKMPSAFKDSTQKGFEELIQSGIIKTALQVGDKMPSFILPDAHNNMISSDNLLKDGALVIVFYRGLWCPYCNLYLNALEGYLPEIKSYGASLVAISGEPPDRSLEVETKDSLTYPVLSDTALVASHKFGIVYEVPKPIRDVFAERGFDFTKYYNSEKAELPLSATYVVNKEGIITYAFLEIDYKLRAEPSDIIKALK